MAIKPLRLSVYIDILPLLPNLWTQFGQSLPTKVYRSFLLENNAQWGNFVTINLQVEVKDN